MTDPLISTNESTVLRSESSPSGWLCRGSDLAAIVERQLTEISGSGGGAGLTLAFSLVRWAQEKGQSVLWLSSSAKPFYPPDAHRAGVDLDRLPVLFLSRPQEAFIAAAKLSGSGGFGLLVWDLVSWRGSHQRLPLAYLGRLNATVRYHRSSFLILTDKDRDEPSLGCLIGLRLQVEAKEGRPDLLEVEVVRDKRGVVGEQKRWQWCCRLPDGLPASAPSAFSTVDPEATTLAG